jgi:hypothetical protein
VKSQQIFSDHYPTGEPENVITWLKFLSYILLRIQNNKTLIFENLHRRRVEDFRENVSFLLTWLLGYMAVGLHGC